MHREREHVALGTASKNVVNGSGPERAAGPVSDAKVLWRSELDASAVTEVVDEGAPRGGGRGQSRRARTVTVLLTRVALVTGFFALWELAAEREWIDPFFYGRPSEIWKALRAWTSDGSLLTHTWATLSEAGLGFIIAVVFAVPIGMFLARSTFWGRVMHPFIDLANSTPRFALAPLFVLIFGLGQTTKVVLAVSVVFFVMLINTIAGVQAIDDNYVKMAQLLNASRAQMFFKVILPATGEWLVAGMRLSAPFALAAAVVGEMISASKGLGFLVVRHAGLLETSKVLAAVLVLAVCGWALNRASTVIALRTPWMKATGGRR